MNKRNSLAMLYPIAQKGDLFLPDPKDKDKDRHRMRPPSPISVDLMLSKLRFLFFLAYEKLPFTRVGEQSAQR